MSSEARSAPAHYRFWPKRLPHQITPPATSLWHNLAVTALRYPAKPALVFFNSVLSYAQVCEKAERLAAHLHSLGVRKGDRVMLLMQNCPQLVISHFAILRANAVVVPVNPMNRAEELRHYITDPDAKVALTTGDLAAELARTSDGLPAAERLRHIVVTQFTDAFDAAVSGPSAPPPAWRDWLLTRHPLPTLAGGEVHAWTDALTNTAPLPELTTGPDDLALLPYTSGTTGLPKGCMHPHAGVMHNAVAASLWVGRSSAQNVMLSVVPMFHITGMVSGMHTSVYSGTTLVIMPRWDRDLAGWLISRWRVTHWTNIPTMVIDLLASPQFCRVRPVQPGSTSAAAARPCRRPWPAAPARAVQPALQRRLWPDRNCRALAQQPARRHQAAVPGHSLCQHRRAHHRPRDAARRCRRANKAKSSSVGRRSFAATGNGPKPRPTCSSISKASASSAPATSGMWTKTATSS